MESRRVVVTGLGIVSSIGVGVDSYLQALQEGKNGFTEISSFETKGFEKKIGAEVKKFDPSKWIKWNDLEKLGRSSQFSVSAACMAIEDSRIDRERLAKEKCGVVVGTTDGEQPIIDKNTKLWAQNELDKVEAGDICQAFAHKIAVSIAEELMVSGEVLTITTACAAGNYAIGYAYDLIRGGDCDLMICGGADSVNRKNFAGFFRLGALSPDVCRPFDRERKGIIPGEGAGILFLESLQSAVARKADIYAEVLGYGLNCDAYHMVSPQHESIADCMRIAHLNAGICSNDVHYISAHGTGTKTNDLCESRAIKSVFKEKTPPTSSLKSMLGHTMGASGALASIGCVLALKNNFIPATMGYVTADPDCDLDCVPNSSRSTNLKVVQNNAFAFGGNNAIVVLRKWEQKKDLVS